MAFSPPPATPDETARDEGSRRLRVAVITRIFPNRKEPLACAFARQQLAALGKRCDVEVLAVIPRPLAPIWAVQALGKSERSLKLREVPERDLIAGLSVWHPRAPYLPGAGRALAPANAALYFAGLVPHIRRLRGRVDVVLGAYLFPDAWAASMVARLLGVPYVVRTHGTDVNVVAEWPSVRPFLRPLLSSASGVVGVSRPMVDKLIALGARPEVTTLVRSGVDRDTFRPFDPIEARRELGLPDGGPVFVFVGRLEKEKGIVELLGAFEKATLPASARLVFVGEGSLEGAIRGASERLGNRVIAVGGHPLERVARYVAAGDALVLPSWAEGTPNVVLESLAAGRPVVASNVGGIPDAIREGETGLLHPPRDEHALARTLERAAELIAGGHFDSSRISSTAPPSWDESASALHGVLKRAVAQRPARSGSPVTELDHRVQASVSGS